jgi:serine phosphatase RsbU (regulator of sigma subunit)
VLRADPDGALTVANAGHLAPYLDAEELQIESGLPLGLAAGTVYTDAKFQLEAGSQLTLMTDGVLEATNSAGELFGFDRTAAISTQPAEEIARSAQQFGQDDDITVLTLAFAPAAH